VLKKFNNAYSISILYRLDNTSDTKQKHYIQYADTRIHHKMMK